MRVFKFNEPKCVFSVLMSQNVLTNKIVCFLMYWAIFDLLCILEPELVTEIMPRPGRCRRGPNACPICGGTGSVIDADGEAESCECINGGDGSCRWCVVHEDVCFI